MRSYKLAKYNIESSIKSIAIYYCILIALIVVTIIGKNSGASIKVSGIEFASIIFLFVMGLNFFKENFYFTQANNIPREDYLKSVAISILPIALGMSMLDVLINRICNLFVKCPTIYDMSYDKLFKPSAVIKGIWTTNNTIETIFRTVIFSFAIYILVFAIGLLITVIYYRCNKTMKTLVSLSPLIVIPTLGCIATNFPNFSEKIVLFIGGTLLGLNTRNSFMATMTFICLFIIVMSFVYMLVRKAVIKRD